MFRNQRTEALADLRSLRPRVHARRAAGWLTLLLLAVLPGAAAAVPMQESWLLHFVAPVQNATGSGNPNVGIDETLGGFLTSGPFAGSGAEVRVTARPGTVSGNVEGWLDVSYEPVLAAPGTTFVEFDFVGDEKESRIQTQLELTAKAKIAGKFLGIGSEVTVGPEFKVNTLNDFTYEAGKTFSAVGESDPLSIGVDVLVAGASVDLSAEAEAFFTPGGVMGSVIATHLDSNAMTMGTFQDLGGANPMVPLDLDRPGYWFVTIADLALIENEFRLNVGLSLSTLVSFLLFGDVIDSEFDIDVAAVDPFELDFDPVERLGGGFLIRVPEPRTSMLVGVALLGLAIRAALVRKRP